MTWRTPRHRTMGLRGRVVLVLALTGLVLWGGFRLFWVPKVEAQVMRIHEREVQRELQVLGDAIVPYLLQNRSGAVFETLATLHGQRPNWVQLTMTLEGGLRLYPLDPPRLPAWADQRHLVPVSAPVKLGSRTLATLVVLSDPTEDLQALAQERSKGAALTFVSLTLAMAAMLFAFDRTVARPLGQLQRAANRLSRGDYRAELPPVTEDEIGAMTRSFDDMRHRISENEATLRQARAAAEVAAETRARFLATISHEVRTPLNGVIPVAELLLETRLDAAQRQQVITIRDSGKALAALIDNILDLSRVEGDAVDLAPEPVDLAAMLGELGGIVSAIAVLRGNTVSVEIDPAIRGRWMADPRRLRQILLNLGSNAVKFTEGGTIRVTARPLPEGGVGIGVADTGIGIALEDQQRIFEPFVQIDDARNRHYSGTGLGLPIARRLAQAMGGTLRVESAPGQGARFCLSLPLRQVEAAQPPVAPPAPVAAVPDRPAVIRVLVVDDNDINRQVAMAFVRRAGHVAQDAPGGAEAVDLVMRQPFDLVLMDVQMPEVDGLEATRRIRTLPGATAQVPVVGLSASAFPDDIAAGLAAGMDDYIAKPLAPDRLAALLDRVADGSLRAMAVQPPSA